LKRLWDAFEPSLAWLSRRAYHLPGVWRVSERLRRAASERWRGSAGRWTVIGDYEGGLRMRVDRTSFIGSALYWRGYHSRETRLLPRLLGPESVFVDVGANQGEFTVAAARCAPRGRVVAVEPAPELREALAGNVRLNGFDNVMIVASALGDRPGTLPLFAQDAVVEGFQNEGTASLWAGHERGRLVADVPVETLDALAVRMGLARVDLIKIDVEGGERGVIGGGHETLRRFAPLMLVELSDENFRTCGYSTADLLGDLQRLGYQAFLIEADGSERPIGPATPLPRVCNALCRPVPSRAGPSLSPLGERVG